MQQMPPRIFASLLSPRPGHDNREETTTTTTTTTAGREEGVVISMDPGTVHCAVVRYDGAADRITHARLYNLFCTCAAELRGSGPMDRLMGDARGKTPARKKQKVSVPTSHDLPHQLLQRMHDEGGAEGLWSNKPVPIELVVVEQQNAKDTGNMTVQTTVQAAYHGKTRLENANRVKAFWNKVAAVNNSPVAFRKGSHQINKTDAKKMGPRVLSQTEQAILRRAAERNAAHKALCPSMLQRDKRRRRKRPKSKGGAKETAGPSPPKTPPLKMDDLVDAALQAIYVYQSKRGLPPEAPHGPALKRLTRGDLALRLEREARLAEQQAKKQAKARSRKRARGTKSAAARVAKRSRLEAPLVVVID